MSDFAAALANFPDFRPEFNNMFIFSRQIFIEVNFNLNGKCISPVGQDKCTPLRIHQ